MHHYDHRGHAGNAGDVWKHLLLLEAASCLFIPNRCFVYAESHVGRPEYALCTPGDWVGGIGKLWPILPKLKNFCYFDILAELNPTGPKRYPGSAVLVLEAAKRYKTDLQTEIWDADPEVAAAWQGFSGVRFHLGDGFSGVGSLLDSSPPGLLLIDPPYIDQSDKRLAEKLLFMAKDLGWVVLWWYMMDTDTTPKGRLEKFELDFAKIGLDGGRWKGCVVAVAGADDELLCHFRVQSDRFIEIISNR